MSLSLTNSKFKLVGLAFCNSVNPDDRCSNYFPVTLLPKENPIASMLRAGTIMSRTFVIFEVEWLCARDILLYIKKEIFENLTRECSISCSVAHSVFAAIVARLEFIWHELYQRQTVELIEQ